MNKIDEYGRVINEYVYEMGFGNWYSNFETKIKTNPCSEIELPKEKKTQDKRKYLLIRR